MATAKGNHELTRTRADGPPPVERCLACEADGVATPAVRIARETVASKGLCLSRSDPEPPSSACVLTQTGYHLHPTARSGRDEFRLIRGLRQIRGCSSMVER